MNLFTLNGIFNNYKLKLLKTEVSSGKSYIRN